jgi:WD40 repeat protein
MLATGTTLGPYKILAALGAGGMGEVYRAHDSRLGRDVAIKVISADLSRDPDRIRRFEQEARAAGALNHPNVCAILDIGTYKGSPFVVMELLEGESLRHRLEQGPIPVRKAIEWAAQAAHGLAAAHEKGIIHRDLKPENLFLTKDGRVKILDFGLAKLTRPEVLAPSAEAAVTIAATETGAILGTVGYMAPEQVRGEPADARSDLFALGAILYELLTGRRAFHGASHVETLHSILNDEPPSLSASGRDVSPGLDAIVRHCLEKTPEERFQSARDLAFALEGLSGSASGTTLAATAKGAPAKARSRFRYAAAFLAGALLVAAIAFFFVRQTHLTDLSRVTYTRLTVQRGIIADARFSPDGKTVFYAAEWDGHPLEVFETRPGFPTSRALGLPETQLLSISRGGTMAVLLGANSLWQRGTLAEVPMSGGAPRRVLDDVGDADWAPDGETLAIAHYVGGKVRLEMPPGHVLYETAGDLSYVRASRDGKWVAFADRPSLLDTRGSMVIMDTTGRIAARTAEWNDLVGAAWSADGGEVWFCASQDLASYGIRALSPDGRERVVARFPGMMCLWEIAQSGQMLLGRRSRTDGIRGRTPSANDERELGWFDLPVATDISADGKSLLFEEMGVYGGPQYAVCLRGMDGSAPVRLGEGHACSLSPDGKWALAIHWGPPQRLLLLPTGAGESTSLPPGQIEKYYDARWMPDGKSIVLAGSEAGHAQRTYIQDLKGGLPSPITAEGIAGTRASPDGRSVAAVSADQALYVCPVNGGSPRLVMQLLPNEQPIQWTPDGRSVYVGLFGPSLSVDRIELGTGRRVPWRTFSLPNPAGVGIWTMALTPDGRSYAYSYGRILDDLYLVDGLK